MIFQIFSRCSIRIGMSLQNKQNIEWVGLILPTPTAEWSASLEQPCRKVMVIPLLLLFSEDNLRMNCSPVCPMFVVRGSTGSCGVGFLQVKRRSLSLLGLPGIIVDKIAGRHSLSYPLSIFFIPRLVRSLVYLPQDDSGVPESQNPISRIFQKESGSHSWFT